MNIFERENRVIGKHWCELFSAMAMTRIVTLICTFIVFARLLCNLSCSCNSKHVHFFVIAVFFGSNCGAQWSDAWKSHYDLKWGMHVESATRQTSLKVWANCCLRIASKGSSYNHFRTAIKWPPTKHTITCFKFAFFGWSNERFFFGIPLSLLLRSFLSLSVLPFYLTIDNNITRWLEFLNSVWAKKRNFVSFDAQSI